ncbi:unnamed protein product [Adineta ricciae]|nr:unnamed protein product [Adineta ricciae]
MEKVQHIRIHDTCGVNNLHGMPGLMAGVAGIVIVFIGNRSGFLDHLTDVCLSGGKQRTANIQAAYQAAALGLTLCVAIIGGLITGAVLRLPMFAKQYENFEDEPLWHLPEINEPNSTAGSVNANLDRRFSIIPVANMNKNLQRRFSVFPQ